MTIAKYMEMMRSHNTIDAAESIGTPNLVMKYVIEPS